MGNAMCDFKVTPKVSSCTSFTQTVLIAFAFISKQLLDFLGPFVQSVVSLTSSFSVISLTVLADSIYNILIFFADKM